MKGMMRTKFKIIYADPPWEYHDKCHAGRRGAEYKYPVMTPTEICLLPIRSIAARNSILFLWTTFPMLSEALDVIRSWGFRYKTIGFLWIKTNSNQFTLSWGMGNWTRSNAEACLLAVRGNPKRINAGVHSVIIRPRLKHSQKPPEIRHQIVKLCGNVPRIELFARDLCPGWHSWGNEIESTISLQEEINVETNRHVDHF